MENLQIDPSDLYPVIGCASSGINVDRNYLRKGRKSHALDGKSQPEQAFRVIRFLTRVWAFERQRLRALAEQLRQTHTIIVLRSRRSEENYRWATYDERQVENITEEFYVHLIVTQLFPLSSYLPFLLSLPALSRSHVMPSRLITNCDDTVLMIAANNGLVDPENSIAASAAVSENEARRLAMVKH